MSQPVRTQPASASLIPNSPLNPASLVYLGSADMSSTVEDSLDLTPLLDHDLFTSEATWLNDLILSAPHNSLAALDSTLSKITSQLIVSTSDTSSLVDRTISDISRSVPRLTFDLQLMRENALLLRFTLDGIRKRSNASSDKDSPVTKVMEKLKVLDLIKQRMEAARDVLREAESWSTLESEVTALVSETSFGKAAERLEEAARSMVVFQNTPEYEARRALMISLQNQLEASLSSSLVKSINERDIKGCKNFFTIFQQIQREQEFTAYYFGSRRSALVKEWERAILEDCPSLPIPLTSSSPNIPILPPVSASATPTLAQHSNFSTPTPNTNAFTTPTTLLSFLIKFYTDLHSLLIDESTYLPFIFPNPSPTLALFIQTTLEGLSPSLPNRLSSLASHLGPKVLPELIRAYRITEDFALTVERIMIKIGSSSSTTPLPSPNPASAQATKMSRRMSRRQMSTSKRTLSFGGGSASGAALMGIMNGEEEGRLGEAITPWEISIFEPFLDFQTDYPSLEKTFLKNEIEIEIEGRNLMKYLVLNSGGGEIGSERILWEIVQVIFSLMEDSVGRLLEFTHGYAAVGLVQLIEEELVDFFDDRRRELRTARSESSKSSRAQNSGVGVGGEEMGGGVGLRRGSTMSGLGEELDDAEDALEGLEYSSEDWGAFQKGLRLLDTCRLIEGRLNNFEAKLKTRLTLLAGSIRDARNDPAGYTIPGSTRGAITILRQSSLNSAALVNLLGPLEKPVEGNGVLSQQPLQTPTHPHAHLHHHSSISLSSSAPNNSGFPFQVNSHPSPHILLPRTKSAISEFTKSTQLFLHETILAPLLHHLSEYSFLPVWSIPTSSEKLGGKGAFELSIPTFSLSPTETISRVGEGLFNLPRLFEVYADDDALAFSIETLPFVDIDGLREMMAGGPGGVGFEGETPPQTPKSASHVATPTTPSLGRRTTVSSIPTQPTIPTPSLPLPAETVIATWLSSLTLAVLFHITTLVLPSISRLTSDGAKQLASDLSYIANVARALDVDSSEDLEIWREAVEWEREEDRDSNTNLAEIGVKEREVRERVAKIRGWKK